MAENTIIHEISLAGYKATSTGGMLDLGTWGSYGIEKLHLTLDAAWQDLTITAFFNVKGEVVGKALVGKDGYADVPWEATKENTFAGRIVFEGSMNNQRRISANLNFKVTNHSEFEDSDPVPTDDRWNQFVTQNKEYRDGAYEAAERANARAEDAEVASEGAQAAARAAKASENAAAASASNAAADAAKAGQYAKAAQAAQEAAEAASDDAQAAARAASASETAAAANEKAAAASEKAAAASAVAAAGSAAQAEAQKTAAEKSASDAQGYMQTASGAATAANASAENAAGSKAAAASSATAAEESKQAAVESEVKAAESEQAAKASEQAAAKSAQAALESKTAAATSEVNAAASAKKAQDVSDSLPADYTAMSGDVGTLKNQMQRAYPDDSTIGENTWSSKHIIDMLCPEIKESGNPVLCYPVAGYPLGVKASWEPVQKGSGTPSPENIRPIKGRDSVRVERCGENLLPFGERIENIYRQQLMPSDALLLLSKAYAEQKLTLTFSVETQNIVFNDAVEDEWRKRIGFECNGTLADGTETYSLQCWLDNRDGELTKNGKKTKTVTVTMPKLANGDITFYAQNIKSGSYVAYGFGIYAGTTAPTTYTPYIGQTNTLTLPSTIYGGEVDAVSGEGQDTWKSVSLDGTEKWNTWGVNKNNTNVTGFFTYDINDYSNDGSDIKKILCSTMSNEEKNIWGGKNMGVGLANSGSSKYLIYCVTTNTLPDTTDDKKAIASFKTFLANLYAAGTPVQVAYKLATQTPFTATGAQPMPALAGANTVLTDADSATVTGRADPIKRITDLEDAVASQT